MKLFRIVPSGVLILGLAIAGCGGSGSSASSATQSASIVAPSSNTQTSKSSASEGAAKGSTTQAKSETAAAKAHTSSPSFALTVSSPALKKSVLSRRYTCDGADTSIPLRWKTVPHGIKELVLFVVNLKPNSLGTGESYSWVVAGLQPTLKGIAAGKVPAGAVVGRNSAGQSRYSLCPAKGSGVQHYAAMLFGLSHPVATKPGFAASTLIKTMEKMALYSGGVGFTYTRK